MRTRMLVCGLLLVMALPLASAQETSYELLLGGEESFTPTVENPLSQQDTIELEFTGRAITNGFIDWTVRETGRDHINCNADQTECNISVDARSQEEFNLTLEATRQGQGGLVIEGTSQVTQLSGDDNIFITVNAVQEGEQAADGLTPAYILVLALMAAGYFYIRRER